MKNISLKFIGIALVFIMIFTAALVSGCGKKAEVDATEKTTDTAADTPNDIKTGDETEDTEPAGTDAADTDKEETLGDPGNNETPATRPEDDRPSGEVASLDNAETVDERIKAAAEPGEGLLLYQIKYINDHLYTESGKELNWYEFYNACVNREISLKGNETALKYAEEMLEYFKQEGLVDEETQAYTIIDVASGN